MRTVQPADFKPKSSHPYSVVVGNLNLLRCLAPEPGPILLATPTANRIARFSRYCKESVDVPSPTRFPEAFIEALLTIGSAFDGRKAALFYDGDADLQCVSDSRDVLSQYYAFLMPDREAVDAYLDKQKFAVLAESKGLKVPRSARLGVGSNIRESVAALRSPMILKPLSRVGWLDSESVWQITNGAKGLLAHSSGDIEEVLSGWSDAIPEFVAQEVVLGPESNILSYHAYVDSQGQILGEYTGRKRRTYPVEFGRSSHIEVVTMPDVIETGREVSKKLNLVGALKLDFKRDQRDGELYLFEVNPRFSIWNYPAAVAGVNLPLIARKDLLTQTRVGSKVRRARTVTWTDAALDRRALDVGLLRYAVHIVPRVLDRRSTFNVWSWTDPGPFLARFIDRLTGYLRRKRGAVT